MIEEIREFIIRLFNADGWSARCVFGKWTEFYGWLYIGFNFAIGTAYFAISLVIYLLFMNKSQETPFKGIL